MCIYLSVGAGVCALMYVCVFVIIVYWSQCHWANTPTMLIHYLIIFKSTLWIQYHQCFFTFLSKGWNVLWKNRPDKDNILFSCSCYLLKLTVVWCIYWCKVWKVWNEYFKTYDLCVNEVMKVDLKRSCHTIYCTAIP